MSGVEVAGTVAAHLSSAAHAPDASPVPDVDQCSVHHVMQRPTWVFPLHTPAGARRADGPAPFLPLDFALYDQSHRPGPLVDTQGHVDEAAARAAHALFRAALGTDQSVFSPQLRVAGPDTRRPPYLAISDWYCGFVRSGLIAPSTGRLAALRGNTATLADGTRIDNVVAVVLATGFDPSPGIGFLPPDVLAALGHSPRHPQQPLALAFHGTHHPDVPHLGFVGMYRSPYWGVMQMQARFLAQYWSSSSSSSSSSSPATRPDPLRQKLQHDDSIRRTLALRDDPRLSQFPMGDYLFLMHDFAEALSIPRVDLCPAGKPPLDLDMLTPSRYPSPSDDAAARDAAQTLRRDTLQTTVDALTTPRFPAGHLDAREGPAQPTALAPERTL
ncbi:hypothetical protein E4U53_004863 [Claviceps sorghi]|nr:hypothetical protein E4U53_004863 [Claviceps sorghi]